MRRSGTAVHIEVLHTQCGVFIGIVRDDGVGKSRLPAWAVDVPEIHRYAGERIQASDDIFAVLIEEDVCVVTRECLQL